MNVFEVRKLAVNFLAIPIIYVFSIHEKPLLSQGLFPMKRPSTVRIPDWLLHLIGRASNDLILLLLSFSKFVILFQN